MEHMANETHALPVMGWIGVLGEVKAYLTRTIKSFDLHPPIEVGAS